MVSIFKEGEFVREYQLEKELGSGAFGKVFKAKNMRTEEIVAIKAIIIDAENRNHRLKMAKREILIHQSLRHQNIVQFIDSFEYRNNIFIVMEYCSNGSVQQRMKQKMQQEMKRKDIPEDLLKQQQSKGLKLPVDEARHYFIDLVQAIRYLHSKIIVHRDLKPANMLLDCNNNVKLCDFGLSTSVTSLKVENNTICGTLNYMPPEVMEHKGITLKADIWSLGCVLYTMLVGNPPFNYTGLVQNNAKYTIPSDVDSDASDLISKLIIGDSSKRISLTEILSHKFIVSPNKVIVPRTCPFKGGVVEILEDGSYRLDIFNLQTLFTVLPNGKEIKVSTRKGDRSKIYEIEKLPVKYQQRYKTTLKIVKEADAHQPLVIWNTHSGKYIIFADKRLALIRDSKFFYVPDEDKMDLRNAMKSIIDAVILTGDAQWPVLVGCSR